MRTSDTPRAGISKLNFRIVIISCAINTGKTCFNKIHYSTETTAVANKNFKCCRLSVTHACSLECSSGCQQMTNSTLGLELANTAVVMWSGQLLRKGQEPLPGSATCYIFFEVMLFDIDSLNSKFISSNIPVNYG